MRISLFRLSPRRTSFRVITGWRCQGHRRRQGHPSIIRTSTFWMCACVTHPGATWLCMFSQ